ncbi:proton-conducting transporter transmembrane domain-containing protein [Robiginitomaculum antarcticum]|uniref:proton-conducting transporter transmembrane domain-containing protein n=1 Tax=Robiginitomaculum antarcticum TaxID=437507 RepID=UPI000367E1BD|nr:proton-conducting transporter membrane subunit [Robiginitomaculum antarcticum]
MSYGPEMALWLLLIIPALAAALIPMAGKAPNIREAITLIAGAALLANVIYLVRLVGLGERPEILLVPFAGPLDIKLTLEPLGAIFAAIASSLWIVNSLFTVGYMRGNNEKNQTRFYTYVAIAIAAAMGIAAAGNLITLFVFYEALTLSTYPLVTHKGDAKARRGGRIYLGILMATSLGLLLPAIIGTYYFAGTTDFAVGGLFNGAIGTGVASVLLLLFAFGIGKAALMPVHMWLPNAMVAPTPVSALLHAVAVVKAGVFTMLKVVLYVFGPDLVSQTGAGTFLAWLAAFSIVAASIIALRKDNLKARLAYSTVSQLSYITLGAMIAAPAALMGGGLQIVMHAWGKITLFMCAGAIYTAVKRTEVSQLDGLGRKMPWVFGAFLVGSASIIGLPPLGGSWPKFMLMVGAIDAGKAVLIAALILSSLLNVAYLMPVAIRGFLKPANDPAADAAIVQPIWVVIPPVITAAGAFILFFFAGDIIDYLRPVLPAGGL